MMINPAFRVNGRATNSHTSTPRESRFVTNNDCCASNGSLFRRRGATSGFVLPLMDISRPPVVMRADGNNIDITNGGGKYATRTSTIDWSISGKRCRKFENGCRKTWL